MELRQERTARHKTAKGEATLNVELDESSTSLGVRWEAAALADASEESRQHDRSPDGLTPIRDAMKELDPARLGHLLDQTATLAGLTAGKPIEESAESWEGQEARKLVYSFAPRLSWTEGYYAGHREGRLTIWTASDGTPLASESVATFDGKTSRVFGRFKGSTRLKTRYAVEGGRLRVVEREVDDLRSSDDGGEVEHTWERFVMTSH
jgi:hypothetical protein